MKRAFTLIEILVVLAIIALLAAILFPAFATARGKARSAACQSNLKQLGAAMTMYIGDYERYPHAVDPVDKYAPQIWQDQAEAAGFDIENMELLHVAMNSYLKSAAVWKCPADNGFDTPDDITYRLNNETTYPSCFGKYGTSYFYRTQLAFLNLSDDFLKSPAETNVLFDGHGDWHTSGVLSWQQKRYNVLFADNHVKNINRQSLTKSWNTPVK
jgi:general secretion pathway protein G